MLNILFAVEDEVKLGRFEEIFKNDSNHSYSFFFDGFEAIEYCKDHPIDIALVSLNLKGADGSTLSEVILDSNNKCRFIFSFKEDELEDAIELFNNYEDSVLIDNENFEGDKIRLLINDLMAEVDDEHKFKSGAAVLKNKENSYKNKIDQMTTILSSRLNCYKDAVRLYTKESALLFEEDSNVQEMISFLEDISIKNIDMFFAQNIDFDKYFEELTNKFSDPANKKLFSLNRCDIEDYQANSYASFIIMLICESFNHYLKAYRGKVDVKSSEAGIKIDVIYDIRAGHYDELTWKYVNRVIKNIIISLSEKCESAEKDGIVQYRIFLKKEYN